MSTIVQAQNRMGFKPGGQRPACWNCVHVLDAKAGTGGYTGRYPFHCTKGSFGVTAQAICNEHERKPK